MSFVSETIKHCLLVSTLADCDDTLTFAVPLEVVSESLLSYLHNIMGISGLHSSGKSFVFALQCLVLTSNIPNSDSEHVLNDMTCINLEEIHTCACDVC